MAAAGPVEALLFDLGGVAIDIDFDRVLRHWERLGPRSLGELRTAFHFDDAYRRHERGEIDAGEYFASLRGNLGLEADDDAIEAGWNALFVGDIPEAVALLREARTRLPCYAFTNSNPTHQRAWSEAFPHVVDAFERVFVSSDLGMRKPEREAFDAVCAAIGSRPETVLFFDDTWENVVGARDAGLQAVHVRSPADVGGALDRVWASRHGGVADSR